MAGPDVFVILGAKVLEGGMPSGVLRRRIEIAYRTSQRSPRAIFIASGAVGDYPPSEASVVRRELVERGVPPSAVVLDEESTDTLESVRACAGILRSRGPRGDVFVCTDGFHIARCRLLFRLYGIHTRAAAVVGGRAALGWRRWVFYQVRDWAAIGVDIPLALLDLIRRGRSR